MHVRADERHELVERGNAHVGDILVQKLEVCFVELVDLNEAEMPPSESGMSWMVKNSIGGVELCGAVAPACMSSISFSVLHDRRPRIQAAANKAEGQ